jgi:molybdate transport system substrate-binding protein
VTAGRAFACALVAFAAAVLGACGDGGPAAGDGGGGRGASIQVAAAADLRTVMGEIQGAMEAACGTSITFVFGSSGQLKTQIEAGARFGLYLSADAAYPKELEDTGLVAEGGRASYGLGRIVVATRAGMPPVASVSELGDARIRTVAIANPAHAPYGRAAEQALRNAGIYDEVRPKLVFGENIRQTTDYVEKGDADAGIVALALVIGGSPASWTLIDDSLHNPIEQAGAVIRGTGAEATGRCLLDYLLGEEGQAALARYGFEPVAER